MQRYYSGVPEQPRPRRARPPMGTTNSGKAANVPKPSRGKSRHDDAPQRRPKRPVSEAEETLVISVSVNTCKRPKLLQHNVNGSGTKQFDSLFCGRLHAARITRSTTVGYSIRRSANSTTFRTCDASPPHSLASPPHIPSGRGVPSATYACLCAKCVGRAATSVASSPY
jgi:hypothetical protein